eukprot:1564301-Pyramimonas_sp.AAC.1
MHWRASSAPGASKVTDVTLSYGQQLWWGERLWLSLWTSKSMVSKRMEGHDTIRMAIILHRHGARLPNKCVTRDLSWPKNPAFYKSYKGHLSPVGCEQLINVGKDLRERYVDGSDLFKGVPPHVMQRTVVAYTSNMQRTLFSAWSFLHGMFPDVPQYFSYAGDRLKVNLRVRLRAPPYSEAAHTQNYPSKNSYEHQNKVYVFLFGFNLQP